MRRKKRISYLITAAIVILLIIAAVIRIKNIASKSSRRPSLTPVVMLEKAYYGSIARKESLTGDILPMQQVNIYSKMIENIEKMYVDIGDGVTKGQLLALIDTTIYS